MLLGGAGALILVKLEMNDDRSWLKSCYDQCNIVVVKFILLA